MSNNGDYTAYTHYHEALGRLARDERLAARTPKEESEEEVATGLDGPNPSIAALIARARA